MPVKTVIGPVHTQVAAVTNTRNNCSALNWMFYYQSLGGRFIMFPVSSDVEEFCILCPKELGPFPQRLLVGLAVPVRIDPRRQIAMNVSVSKAPVLLIVHRIVSSRRIDTNRSQWARVRSFVRSFVARAPFRGPYI